jgi:hypothetical protein
MSTTRKGLSATLPVTALLVHALQVPDAEAARFIACCVGDPQQRYTASQLLEDPFLQVRRGGRCRVCLHVYATVLLLQALLLCFRCQVGATRSVQASLLSQQ